LIIVENLQPLSANNFWITYIGTYRYLYIGTYSYILLN
jgi:hypothetical protein